MLSWVIQGSPVRLVKRAMISSWPLSPQSATLKIRPSSRSAPISFSISGAPSGEPLPTTGMRPLLSLNSSSFSSTSLLSGIAESSSSRKSGRAERTLSISGVASDSGGVNT